MAHLSDLSKAIAGNRVTTASASLPQTTDAALFTISGGPVIITALWGEVTTAIQNQINNTKLKFNPTATGADQDLCAVLSIADDAVGEIYSITGTVTDAMTSDLLVGNVYLQDPLFLSEGDIELDCAASNTGAVKWGLFYIPAENGATVTAA